MRLERDAIYSIEELAQLFGVSRRTMVRWLHRGYMPIRRIGHKIYVVGRDLLDNLPEAKPALLAE
jgi:excisionase family DNA binding protein